MSKDKAIYSKRGKYHASFVMCPIYYKEHKKGCQEMMRTLKSGLPVNV